ncbi:type II toxin-antitoxin system HipA family toxin [Maribacter algarum]|uniref:Type II toxin-antitoxin system HipA family toxin n=1 Tax=Maribacter algarum (ex Zhang et al. 2020) TaxID=2578118 RepID=A0A5S3PN35_9FLAO|nr:type II toxin-antitoxin system HipA family toxin [Maribacter algarum]TMM55846.1 type II toxin-antitoxin system HipA family toxin [Maribacter algarum]
MVDAVEIKIWGELVGAARWDTNQQLASFQFDKKFLTRNQDLSPIKMPIKNGDRIYSFPELRKSKNEEVSTFKGLPGLLADALPDKYGNQLINIWLAQQGRPPNSMNPVEQLCFIGLRGMGALEFHPASLKSNNQTFAVEIKSLVEVAQKMLSNRENFETNLKGNEQKAMSEILTIGTSAGGARPKAVIAYNEKTGEVRSGQTDSPKGFEHWLIKLDGVSDAQFGKSFGFGRVEYAYYLMAKDCGINMMECRLLEENERAHFMTKRFDREGNNTKHHIQTLCGIQHFDYNNLQGYSYEQLFQTMRILKLTYPEAEQMFRRMVFNVMATNYDDHTKNFSFRLKENSKWELSPAYDVCYSFDPNNIWVSQHTLSINGKHKNIEKSDLMKIAKDNNIKKGEKIISEIKDIVTDWKKYATKANVSNNLYNSISKTLVAPIFNE